MLTDPAPPKAFQKKSRTRPKASSLEGRGLSRSTLGPEVSAPLPAGPGPENGTWSPKIARSPLRSKIPETLANIDDDGDGDDDGDDNSPRVGPLEPGNPSTRLRSPDLRRCDFCTTSVSRGPETLPGIVFSPRAVFPQSRGPLRAPGGRKLTRSSRQDFFPRHEEVRVGG